ncbi:MAG: PAS domain-containing sensor histidine kinase [Firmicutes bacterium]|nr:PAS domain-containing sensor histidine kinase [Bacillota bacterium]
MASEDFTLQDGNDLFAEILGMESRGFVGKNLCDVLPEITKEILDAKLECKLPEQGYFSLYLKSTCCKGTKKPVTVFIYPVKNTDGDLTDWMIVAKEFTINCRRGEKDNPDYYIELTDSLPDMIIETDVNLKINLINKAVITQFQYSKEEINEDFTFFNLIPRYEWEKAIRLATDLYLGNPVRPVEFKMIRKDGMSFAGEIFLSNIFDNNCQVTGFRGIIRDLTYRREIENRNSLNAQILSSISDAIIVTDVNFFITDCNLTAEEIIGKKKDELLGNLVFDILNFDTDFSGTQIDFASKLDQYGCFKIIISFNQSGLKRWLEVRISELKEQEGGRQGWVFLSSDISESKMLEESLKTKNARMEAFAYTISHDLVSPLTGIEGFTGLLTNKLQDKLDDESQVFISRVRESSARMKKMIRNIYKIFRLGLNKSDLEIVNVPVLIKSLSDGLHPVYKDKTVHVNYEGIETVITSEVLMKELLYNLIDNGLKYNRSDVPSVEIHGVKDDENGEIVFTVKDNGIGISQKDHDKVFMLFKRLKSGIGDSKNYSGDSGTGAGLAICKTITEELGGTISVESDGIPGEGSVFRFTLPLNPADYHFKVHNTDG